mmetsp:Transcript_29908/g.69160  ORF Transcript_29908/g.69160 Transcript_29908/m.69160 type:complete len:528 (+) Transcript_29908:16-1599(+)
MQAGWRFGFLAICLAACAQAEIKLPKVITSGMVLQAETPALWGYAEPHSNVSISVSDGEHVHVVTEPSGKWEVVLSARNASDQAVVIKLEETDVLNPEAVHLDDVLFGDVWLCSGQSNMEFSVAMTFDAAEIIDQADNFPTLRLFAVQKNASGEPLEEIVDVQEGWVASSRESVCGAEYGARADYCEPHCGGSAADPSYHRPTWGYFSAVCYIYGRELLKATGRPQGMVESCWGGTAIELWSSPKALAKCGSSEPPPPLNDTEVEVGLAPSTLYNAMIVPLLPMSMRGAIWYQGEANTGDEAKAKKYRCQLRAMAEDWRSSFRPTSLPPLAFFVQQLAAYSGPDGFLPVLRNSQAQAVASLPNAGLAVGIDLADPGSPCHDVHIRNKTAVGQRLALAALAVSYGESVAYLGPVPVHAETKAEGVEVEYAGEHGEFVTINQTTSETQCFEVHKDGSWVSASASVKAEQGQRLKVIVHASGDIKGVRYAWSPIPTGQQLYDDTGLPGIPWAANCSGAGICDLDTQVSFS